MQTIGGTRINLGACLETFVRREREKKKEKYLAPFYTIYFSQCCNIMISDDCFVFLSFCCFFVWKWIASMNWYSFNVFFEKYYISYWYYWMILILYYLYLFFRCYFDPFSFYQRIVRLIEFDRRNSNFERNIKFFSCLKAKKTNN